MSTTEQSTERAQHTAEPWYFGRTAADKRIILGGSSRRYVATVQIYQTPRQMGIHDELEREGNGRRILAAVNACTGIPTEALESGVVRELLETCRRAEEFIRNGVEFGYIRMPDADTPDPALDTPEVIRAAIAKAEGRDHA